MDKLLNDILVKVRGVLMFVLVILGICVIIFVIFFIFIIIVNLRRVYLY